jgi:predicted nucleic acid-binding protein
MENDIICLDTSVLIEFFRKTNKEKSFLFELNKQHSLFAVSSITVFEIYCGTTDVQSLFWDSFFSNVVMLPFDDIASKEAARIYQLIKGNMIDIPDLFIGATALVNGLALATLNEKHFTRIPHLQLIVSG